MIGVLGGGQLARMLKTAGFKRKVTLSVFAGADEDPALQIPGPSMVGSVSDPNRLREFFTANPIVIFENEFLDTGVLKTAAKGMAVEFVPDLKVIAKVQDKLEQKRLFTQLGMRTAPFQAYEEQTAIGVWLESQWNQFGGPFVIKWARMGYDGKGTFFFDSYADMKDAEAFVRKALKLGYPVYAEKRIKFIRELAMVGVYSKKGSFVSYPLVISEQTRGICHWVTGPAVALGVNHKLEGEAARWCEMIAKNLDLRGAFALEFFEGADGNLWVNELAPRVHNTGHYSQDACEVSQFENHVLACLGEEIPSPGVKDFFVMLNLVGPDGVDLSLPPDPDWGPVPNRCRLEWYGKRWLKGGRKMGHINGLADSSQNLQRLREDLEQWEAKWRDTVETMRSTATGHVSGD